VQQLSTPDELYEAPQNSFVAQFIGENNKLTGKIEAMNGTVCDVRLADGTLLKAEKVNVDGVGDSTTLSLRPERVEFDNPESLDNTVTGRIEEMIYLGDHIRIRMSVAGNPEFIAKVRNRGQKREMREGQDIKIGWAASDCKALDAVA